MDACFHDGFSPDKNRSMWSPKIFNSLKHLSHNETTYSTFSSSSVVKERLKDNGFKLKISKGFGNKRHMIKAEFNSKATRKRNQLNKNIAIIGAGIAGCSLAKILSSKGHKISLFDKKDKILSGASGNKSLVTYPNLSAFDSPYSLFSLHSYLFSTRFYDELDTKYWNKTGVLLLDFNKNTNKRFKQLLQTRNDSKIFKYVTSEEASKIAGIELSLGGLFFPEAGWLNPKGVFDQLIMNDNIEFISKKVKKISESTVSLDNKEYEFDHVCLCSSHESNRLIELKGIGKKRGQITYLQKEREISNLEVPVCASGYISPTSENLVLIGSTYTDNNHKGITLEENLENIEKLKLITKQKVKIVGANFGYRSTTPDRLPLVGKTNGIFISICHGSRGSCSAPISAQFICDLIDKSPPVFGKKMTKALNPERFKERA